MPTEIEINVRPVFSTPLLVFTVAGHERINTELSRLILQREAAQPTFSDYEVVGWSSPHDLSMLEWAEKPLGDLFGPVMEVAKQMTEYSERAAGQRTGHPDWQVVELWANVQRKGGSNGAHPHPGSYWSGVYYVDVGDVGAQGTGGELQLYDPRGCLPRMLAPYLRYAIPELHDAGNTISFTPTTGQCVMFPGWQYHAVAPYLGKAPRISVAFNLDPILPK